MADQYMILELKRTPAEFTISNIVEWGQNDNVGEILFLFLANCLQALSEVEDDLKDSCLCNILRIFIEKSPRYIYPVVSILTRSFVDEDGSFVVEASKADIMAAISQASGKSVDVLKYEMQHLSDLASLAESNRAACLVIGRRPHTIDYLFSKIIALAKDSVREVGRRGRRKKLRKTLLAMFVAASEFEAGILVRLLQPVWTKVPENVVLHALACATVYADRRIFPEDIPSHVDRAVDLYNELYKLHQSLRLLCDAYPCDCYKYMPEIIGFAPGIPLELMEAEHTHGISEILNKFDLKRFAYESNDYDEVIRAQV
ncbi:DNA ligase 1-like [Salvia splendens]|nr:DNA ligase 1-like [Salvia splendens]